MASKMDRRTFLKTTAAAAAAISMAGLLGGCNGAGEGVQLNGYAVNVKKATKSWGGPAGAAEGEETGYLNVSVVLTAGNGVSLNTTMGVFSAKTSAGQELTLENKYNPVVGVQNVPLTVDVSFSTKDKAVYDALCAGTITMLLQTNLTGGDRAVQHVVNFATGAITGSVVQVEEKA